jgi:hypothetical protein
MPVLSTRIAPAAGAIPLSQTQRRVNPSFRAKREIPVRSTRIAPAAKAIPLSQTQRRVNPSFRAKREIPVRSTRIAPAAKAIPVSQTQRNVNPSFRAKREIPVRSTRIAPAAKAIPPVRHNATTRHFERSEKSRSDLRGSLLHRSGRPGHTCRRATHPPRPEVCSLARCASPFRHRSFGHTSDS